MLIKKVFLVLLSLIIAMMLAIFPLPHFALWLRPAWVALILIYWIIVLPNQVSIGIAWLLGLMMDMLDNSLLGEHALALVLVSFCVLKLYRQIRMFSLIQQSLFVGVFIFLYQFVLFIIQGITGEMIIYWQFWVVPLVSIFYWPFLYIVLQAYRQRYRIR